VLPAAVWILGVVSPPREGLTPTYLIVYTALLVAVAVVDQTMPSSSAPPWRRLAWIVAEVVLCGLVVRTQGTLIRPALLFMLPVGRSILLFGERAGLLVSLLVWVAYGINIAPGAWPANLGDYPNYLSFFLAPYAVAAILSLAIVRQERTRQRMQTLYDELSAAHTELQAMHQQVRSAAVAQERNRLAREIHDSLAHYLTIVNIQLEAAEKLGTSRAEAALEHVRRARRLTLDCLQDVRRSVGALRASTLEELALESSLRRLVADFAESTGLRIEVDWELDDAVPLAAELAQAIYRAVQEGLTNVERHARAKHVWVSLSYSHECVVLELCDDGRGTAEPTNGHASRSSGYGLLGLRERVALLDGELVFGPTVNGTGSRLRISLPLSGPREHAVA
jgi:signal transduction histidine kinase